MKLLSTCILGLTALARAVPLADPTTNDYEVPAAPVEVVVEPVNVVSPVAPAQVVVEQRILPVPQRIVPFAPAPLRSVISPVQQVSPVAFPAPIAPQPIPAPHIDPRITPVALPQPIVTPVAPRVTPVAVPQPVVNAIPAPAPVAVSAPVPSVVNSQFHAQDELGGFSFGYANDKSTKQEIRTPDGVTRGRYSYVDANGLPQVVEYVSDPVNGFRVAGTNIPVADQVGPVAIAQPVMDTEEVKAAKAEFKKAFEEAVARNAEADAEDDNDNDAEEPAERKKREALTNDYKIPLAPVQVVAPTTEVVSGVAPFVEPPQVTVQRILPAPLVRATIAFAPRAPVIVARQPIAPVAPVAPIVSTPVTRVVNPLLPVAPNSQFHAQDDFGGFSIGYSNAQSSRQESRSADGVTRGSYSYVDANGILQTVSYTADAVHGFRVVGTNLPVAPKA